jgi:hypothetical protein
VTRGIRSASLTLLRELDHALGRRHGTRRVLVDVRTPMNLAVLRPMWRRLTGDPRVTVEFTAEDEAAVAPALARDGLAGSLRPRAHVRTERFDLALTADAWNNVPLSRCRRRLYFFHGVAGKYDLDAPERLRGLALDRFDRVAFINEDRQQRYLAAGVVRSEQAIVVGFPKLDDLVNGAWPAAAVRRELGLAPDKPTVIYAPTFSPAGSLHVAGEAIVEALLAGGFNAIVKLHDRSMVPHERFTAGIDWPERLRRFESFPGFAFARDGDAGPYLAAADVMVTDHSTVGFEFALLDRPLVIFDAPTLKEAARIDGSKWALLRSMADVVDSAAAVPGAVRHALALPARHRDERRASRSLFAFPGDATDRALAVVYELLQLEAVHSAQFKGQSM